MTTALYNLVRMTTPSTGTGVITLGSAVPGFNSFSAAGVPSGAFVSYSISDGGNSEVGRGVYNSTAGTITRQTILASTNGGAAINLSGSAQIALSPLAQDLAPQTDYPTRTAAQNDNINPSVTFLRTAGYSTVGDGGGASYASTNSSTPGGFQSADGGWWRLASNMVTPEMFGAPANGTGDDAPAFAAFMASSFFEIELSAKTYNLISAGIVMNSAKRIVGAGRGQTTIQCSAMAHAIQIAVSLTGWELSDFTLSYTGASPPTSAQDGIHVIGHCEQAQLSRLLVQGFWNNYRLAATSYSQGRSLFSTNSWNRGILSTNSDNVLPGLQWDLDDLLMQQSNGLGVEVQSTMAPGANIGPITNWWSYANTGGGIKFGGTPSAPINGVRLGGVCFSGSEGSDSVIIDTYGGTTVHIEGVETEENGLDNTGVNLGTAPSGQGRGFYATQNNQMVSFTANSAEEHSWCGIETAANRALLIGNTVRECGQAGLSGEVAGIQILTGNSSNVTVVGNVSKGNQFGIYLFNDNHVIVGNDFSENTNGAIGATGALTLSVIGPNKGGNGPAPSTGALVDVTTLNFHGLVTVDPHVVGQLWNNSGVMTISAG